MVPSAWSANNPSSFHYWRNLWLDIWVPLYCLPSPVWQSPWTVVAASPGLSTAAWVQDISLCHSGWTTLKHTQCVCVWAWLLPCFSCILRTWCLSPAFTTLYLLTWWWEDCAIMGEFADSQASTATSVPAIWSALVALPVPTTMFASETGPCHCTGTCSWPLQLSACTLPALATPLFAMNPSS